MMCVQALAGDRGLQEGMFGDQDYVEVFHPKEREKKIKVPFSMPYFRPYHYDSILLDPHKLFPVIRGYKISKQGFNSLIPQSPK